MRGERDVLLQRLRGVRCSVTTQVRRRRMPRLGLRDCYLTSRVSRALQMDAREVVAVQRARQRVQVADAVAAAQAEAAAAASGQVAAAREEAHAVAEQLQQGANALAKAAARRAAERVRECVAAAENATAAHFARVASKAESLHARVACLGRWALVPGGALVDFVVSKPRTNCRVLTTAGDRA